MFQNVSKVVLCVRCITFASFSQDDTLHLSWQEQRFGDLHRHFAWQAQHFRRVVLRIFANRNVRAASSDDKVQIPWQAWDMVRVSFVWQALHLVKTVVCPMSLCVAGAIFSTPYLTLTLHFTFHSTLYRLYSLHSTLYTSRFALYTLHPKLYTLHFTLHPTPYT